MQLLKSVAGWDATPAELFSMNSLAVEELCSKTLAMVSESLISGEQAATLLSSITANGLTCLGIAIPSNDSDKLRIFCTYLTALLKTGAIDFEYCLIVRGKSADRSTTAHRTTESLALEACEKRWGNTLEVYADLLINLANIYIEVADLNWLFLNDHITEQIMGPASLEPVHVMLWDLEGGDQFRASLQQFLVRLTNTGVWNRAISCPDYANQQLPHR